MIKSIDLFCGVGGLTHGLERAGIQVIAGIDVDKTCQFAYEKNNKAEFINIDIKSINKEFIESIYCNSKVRLLAGCAPCQPFSSLSRSVTKENKLDKWFLLDEFTRLIKETEPELVTMENVPDLMKEDVFMSFIETLKTYGYNYDFKKIYCPDYGLPQSRTRLVLIASKFGEIKLPEATHTPERYVTLRDAIGSLKELKAGEIDPNDSLHRASTLSDLNLKRISQSKPGGTWRDWDESLVAKCHKKDSGKSYSSVYGRLEWDKISSTITTQFNGYGNGRFGHPEQNRALSLREGAILQSFPAEYKFVDDEVDVVIGDIARHIGNAVPVVLGELIGKIFSKHIKEYINE